MPLRAFIDIETVPPDTKMKSKLKPDVLRRIMRDANFTSALKQKARDKDTEVSTLPNDETSSNACKSKGITASFHDNDCQEECTEEMFRRLALHAEYGRVLCIGVILERDGAEIRKGVFGLDNESQTFHLDETKTLRGFWKLLKEEFSPRRDLIVGHNVMDFDLPFIYKRSRIKRVNPTVEFCFARYRSAPIFDTMREWALWNLRESPISLSLLAELLELEMEKTSGIDGSKVYDEFLAGNHQLIADYCLQDVQITRAIFHQLAGC